MSGMTEQKMESAQKRQVISDEKTVFPRGIAMKA
jgi:hypothetical protein